MLAKKPEIILFTNTTNTQLIREICAGIEEEGLLYRCVESVETDAIHMAVEASKEATIGVGIGVSGARAVLTHESLKPEKPLFVLQDGDREKARSLGKNAARFIKKMPLSV